MSIKNKTFPKLALSIDEAIETSGLGRTKLYQVINSGELVARKHGKRTLILSDDLEDFLCGLEFFSPKKQEKNQ